MDLLKSVTGLLGGENNGSAVGSLLNMLIGEQGQEGGLGNIISQLQSSGLGEQVTSWLGSGENLPISAEQIQSALADGALSQIAGMLNLGEGDAAGQLAQLLPGLVDKMSPDGDLNVSQSQPSDLMGLLGSLLK